MIQVTEATDRLISNFGRLFPCLGHIFLLLDFVAGVNYLKMQHIQAGKKHTRLLGCFPFRCSSFAPSVTWASSVQMEHKRPEHQHSWDASCRPNIPHPLHIAVFPCNSFLKTQKQKSQHFSHASLSLLSPHCISIATAAALLSFLPLFIIFCFFRYFPLVSSTVCHVSAIKRQSGSVSRGRRGFSLLLEQRSLFTY